MNELSFSAAIKNDPELAPRVQRASQILEEAIGAMSKRATVSWKLISDTSNCPLLFLRVSDETKAFVEATFSPDDLVHEDRLRARFYRLWGDLLQFRSHLQLQQLSDSSGTSGPSYAPQD
jgi:hypothetical protein